ncbi:MAG: hydroxymethylglutaryl-CoA lyase [Acidimicrobiales bacterium]
MGRSYPVRVVIRDVGPRDGLQPESPVSASARVALVEALVAAGVRHVEVAAFVSPKAVPAMAEAAEVVAGLVRHPEVTYAALVPNARGAELALAAGVDELTVTISASEAYNQRNVKMSTDESVTAIEAIVGLASAGAVPVPVDAVISCAFGSPYEGEIAPGDVVALASRLAAVGAASLTYADTTGMATPRRIDDLVDALDGQVAGVGLHLHDTRGAALVNAYAALERGIARFDTSVGGLGGSPFAHGAGGNLATEGLGRARRPRHRDRHRPRPPARGRHPHRLAGGPPPPSLVAHHGPRTRLATPAS